jgi:hypothetical protein
LIFDPTLPDDNDPADLRGGKRAARTPSTSRMADLLRAADVVATLP